MHLYSLGGSGMYYDRTENLYLKMTMLDDVIKSMLNVTRLFLISNTFVSNARLKLDLFETRILKMFVQASNFIRNMITRSVIFVGTLYFACLRLGI